MGNEKEPKKTTPFLLGEISAEVKSVKAKIIEQNGSIDKLKGSINGLSEKFNNLPCEIHSERIGNIIQLAESAATVERQEETDKKRGRRDLVIGLIAAIVTGGFTIFGVWLSTGGASP